MMVAEFNYKLQVEHLSKKNKISLHRARVFIKEYRRLLKHNLYVGNKIDVLGIACVYPSIRQSVNEVFDIVYNYEKQVEDLKENLSMETFEVHHLLKSYLSILINKLSMGYSIKISGVFLLKPEQFENNQLGYITRLSPSLEKPDMIKLKVKRIYGNIDELDVEQDKLIYRLEISDKLLAPKNLRLVDDEIHQNITFLDESFLG